MTSTVSASTDTFAELAAAIRGRVIADDSPDYPALSTPWNVARTSHPVAVVEVTDAHDVAATVRFAAANGLDVAVQLTGHGAVAFTRPTLLVHTRLLDEITIRAEGSARVGAGVLWAQVLEAAAPYGLGGLAGSSPGVGVVGYHTGGGLGPIARTFGYAADHVTAFDVVTGDGEIRRATATENPDLFWGLRGGKGALGIVTAIEFGLLPLREIYAGCLYFDGADAATVAHAWRSWGATLPEQGSTSLAILRLPDMPVVPPPLAGRCTVAVRFAWVGDVEDGRRAIAELASVAPVIFGGTDVMPYTALGMIHADPVDPIPAQERNVLLHSLPASAVDELLTVAGADTDCPQVIVELRQLGGAIARAPHHASAVSHRDAAYSLLTIGLAVPPLAEPTARSAAAVLAAMAPWSDGWGQPNFAASADPTRIARNYDAATLTRLGAVAATYDPHGLLTAGHAVRAACGLAG